ncbi:MAG: hypothetical protein ACRENG_15165 [bacterium]
MKSFLLVFSAALLTIWNYYAGANDSAKDSRPAPEFPRQDADRWINSAPLKMTGNGENGLRGKVVLLNVWTFM